MPARRQIRSKDSHTPGPASVGPNMAPTHAVKYTASAAGGSSADGITFAIQNSSPTAAGEPGGGIGYGGIADSLVVEFDTASEDGDDAVEELLEALRAV